MYRLLVDIVLNPVVVLNVLTAIGILRLWTDRRETKSRLLLPTIAFLALMLCSTPAVAYLALGTLEWSFPPLNERPVPAKAIVVLGGSMNPPDKWRKELRLGTSTLYRSLEAARLYRSSSPCSVFASGGAMDSNHAQLTLAEAMRDFLAMHGVNRDDIVVETKSKTTYENALYTSRLLKEREISTIVLVTDATHLARAIQCFEAQGLNVIPAGARYRATEFRWDLDNFFPNSAASGAVQDVFHEWIGLAWYRLSGRT